MLSCRKDFIEPPTFMSRKFSRSDSKVLVEIPWHTQVVMGQESLEDTDMAVCFQSFVHT